jgi:hypothetical protein
MSQKTKELIVLISGKTFESFNIEPYISNRLRSIVDPFYIKTKNNGTPIQKLRKMFKDAEIKNIQKYIKTNKIIPDIYCFENAVIGQNAKAIMFAVREYGYVPTLPIIMKCSSFHVRLALLNIFYPDMVVFNFVCDKKKVKSKKKPIVKPKTELTVQTVTIESNPHILPDERPIKKISKKPTSKPSNSVMFVSFD